MSRYVRAATGCYDGTLSFPYAREFVISGPVQSVQNALSFKCNHCGGVNRWKLDAEPAHKCRYCGAPPT